MPIGRGHHGKDRGEEMGQGMNTGWLSLSLFPKGRHSIRRRAGL